MTTNEPLKLGTLSHVSSYTEIMVDIETLGTRPDRNHLIQIAAVRFDLSSMTISSDIFNKSLTECPHRSTDPMCIRNFWYKSEERRAHLHSLQSKAEPWRDVTLEFVKWVNLSNRPRFWAKNSSLDFGFLSSYFHDCGIANPFNYWMVEDINNWLRSRYHPATPPYKAKDNWQGGMEHDAIADCLAQIATLFRCMRETRTTSVEQFNTLKGLELAKELSEFVHVKAVLEKVKESMIADQWKTFITTLTGTPLTIAQDIDNQVGWDDDLPF